MNIYLYSFKGEILQKAKIACGKNYGNKEAIGDNKTPEGVFNIAQIENSSHWKHNFDDGKGEIEGAYGPYFIRLNVPGQKGIGIHGTHDAGSIGNRLTEGCIRLKNDDLVKLVNRISSASIVIIIPSQSDADSTIISRIKNEIRDGSSK